MPMSSRWAVVHTGTKPLNHVSRGQRVISDLAIATRPPPSLRSGRQLELTAILGASIRFSVPLTATSSA